MTSEIDFNEIRNNLREYLRSQDTLQDYDFDGSAISSIIDLLAYTTHINAVNANLGLNETFLDTAQFRGSVVGHARQLGYTPRSATASRAVINVTVNNPNSNELTLQRGHPFRASSGGTSFTFVPLETFTTDDAVFRNVHLVQGTFKSSEFIFDSRSGEKFLIPQSDVDVSTIQVTVFNDVNSSNSRVFSPAKNLTEITSDSNVFFLSENPDERYEIMFGDGVIGTALDDGNYVVVDYVVTQKAEANGSSVFSTNTAIQGNSNITIDTVQPARGGDERESIEAIRRNAPLSFAAQNRAVVPQDYESIIREGFSNVESVKVWGGEDNDPPKYGKVFVSIKPKDAEVLTDNERDVVLNDILIPKSMLTVDPELVNPEFLYIVLEVFFKYDPSRTNLTEVELENKVVENIEEYNRSSLTQFDRVFRYSQLLSVIDNTDDAVLNSFARVYVQKRFIPRLNVSSTYELDFSVDLFKSFGTRPVIFLSSEFTVNGLDNCRFTDVLDNNDSRRIQIVRGDPSNPQVVVSNAGFIEGSKLVLVNFRPERIEGGVITIECIPDSYNVFGKRNTVLSIDCNCPQFSIDGSIDTFAIGAEYAGETYEVAPKNANI